MSDWTPTRSNMASSVGNRAMLLQRKCACGSDASGGGECEECKKKEGSTLQRFSTGRGGAGAVPPIVHDVLRSTGKPLDAPSRAFFEPRFGYDFSRVRVHTDARASESARRVNALAYTVGRDVVFGMGQFSPHSSRGQRLLAHELAHVVQQGQGPASGGEVDWGDGHLEMEAEKAADRAVSENTSGSWDQPSLSSSGSPVVQRVTDQPELQTGIGVGMAFGGATVGFLTTCLMRAGPVQGVGMLAYRIARIVSASGARRQQLIDELVTQQLIPTGALMTTICDCMPPQLIAGLAKWGLRDYPDALSHLEHYLDGSGLPISEDIPRLLRDDSGVRTSIERGIAVRGKPVDDLRDWVGQHTYTTKNWEYTLGNVDLLHYEILDDSASKAANAAAADGTAAVRVSIRDPYQWHPDVGRAIPCLHTGLEAMRASGAKEYLSLGDGVVRLTVPKALVPLP